ncbi:MAG: hypothetical protein RL660_320 [Bacteroidota bacterium]|jgi:hypothetical protein
MTSFSIRLSQFAVRVLIGLFYLNDANAQIIYTDIPDATPSASFALDLNNDLVDDFIISYAALDKIICIAQNNNAFAGDSSGNLRSPWALPSFSNICDTNNTWYDSSEVGIMAWGANSGNWVSASNKYLALKLVVGGNVHYGWARLDLTANSLSFTIKDYAYNSIANACIQAGQTTLKLKESDNNYELQAIPNPFTTTTIIKCTHKFTKACVTICNVNGQVVRKIENVSGNEFEVQRENLPFGMYVFRISEDNTTLVIHKLLIGY